MDNKQRREKTITELKKQNIAFNTYLPILESDVKLKDKATVCRRAVANMLAIQHACDFANGDDVKESRKFFKRLLKSYGVAKDLLPIEESVFKGKCTEQDVTNVIWTYEANWVLLWALGKIETLDFPKDVCKTEEAIAAIQSFAHVDDFIKDCELRSPDEILDALDQYYCYHWACVEKRIKPDTNIGELNPDVVVERRKALEWLISGESDWNEISLDT
ncbi:MAG: DUF4272 domain-containing protein [Clostridiales bacterium]|nr:DUF4272 domain-containing protein [Clostridiales bacterium]